MGNKDSNLDISVRLRITAPACVSEDTCDVCVLASNYATSFSRNLKLGLVKQVSTSGEGHSIFVRSKRVYFHTYRNMIAIFINIRDADDLGATKGFRASRSSVLLKY